MSRGPGARPPLGARPAPRLDEVTAAYAAARGVDPATVTLELASIREQRGRRIIEYRVRPCADGTPGERLISKVYRDENRSEATFRIMRHAWSQGMGADTVLTMVQPLARLRHRCTVLMTHAPGAPLAAWLDRPPAPRPLARQAAEWLLRLHRVPAIRGDECLAPRAQADLDRMTAELSERLPTHSRRIDRLRHRLRDLDRKIPRHSMVFVHGDLHPRNLFVASTRLTAIDFDHAGMGDAAWELSYLVTQLEIMALRDGPPAQRATRRDRARRFGRELLAAYRARAHHLGSAVEERLARSRALTLLESLHYDVAILQLPQPQITELLITEAEASLAAVASAA